MKIDTISISGFANIHHVRLSLQEITALVAPNGYGKSNLLRAIEFGCHMVTADEQERTQMMSLPSAMPANRKLLKEDFRMEICGTLSTGSAPTSSPTADTHFEYGFSFMWEGSITSEWLRIRQGEKKFRQALSRSSTDEFVFLSSPTGRCTTKESITGNQLAIQRMAQKQVLFFAPLVKQLASLTMPQLNTLDNPETYFSADNNRGVDLFDGQTLSAYLYHLREQKPAVYEVLRDGIQQLVPHLTRFDPQEIVLADGRSRLYDILIEERNSAYPTSVRQMSSGSKRVVLLLTLCLAVREKGLPLLMIEEPENSVHPRLLENLLLSLHDYAGETKVLLTSHSPYLMRHLRANQMYFGLPNDDDVAFFARLKDSKVRTVAKYASAMELTIGEYMFDFMLDLEQETEKIDTFFQT